MAEEAERPHRFNNLDRLICRTFVGHPEGEELLALWTEALIHQPVAISGEGLLEIGMREGKHQFVRSIIATIKRMENING